MSGTISRRLAPRLALLTFLTPVLFASAPSVVSSAEAEVGAGLICDTRSQVERFAALMDEGLETAINRVNTEENNPNACGFAVMAYSRGADLGTVRTRESTFQIIEITVIGVHTPSGFQAVTPTAFYSLEKVEEIAV